MFTRQHYEALAKVLKDSKWPLGSLATDPRTILKITGDLMEVLREDNERFDFEKFRKASGQVWTGQDWIIKEAK
jgi:hypothetical protein